LRPNARRNSRIRATDATTVLACRAPPAGQLQAACPVFFAHIRFPLLISSQK
jgi:hypothetical protein